MGSFSITLNPGQQGDEFTPLQCSSGRVQASFLALDIDAMAKSCEQGVGEGARPDSRHQGSPSRDTRTWQLSKHINK